MVKEILNTLTARGRRSLVLSILGFTLYALAGVVMMLVVLRLLEQITGGGARMLPYWVALLVCLLVKGASNVLADTEKHFAGFDIVYQIREKIIYRLKSFSLGFYTGERLGEISTIVHKDVDNMEMIVAHMWTRMCADFIVSVLLLLFLLWTDWRMALLMVAVLPLALLLLALGLKKAGRLERENGNNLADMVSLFVEYVKGIPLLKAFSESKKVDAELEAATARFGESSKRAAKNKAAVLARYGFLVDAAFWVMAAVGIVLVLAGSLPVAAYLVFVVVSREFYKPFTAMEGHWSHYLSVTDSFRRIRKITGAPTVSEPALPQSPRGYGISFEDVSFYYEEGEFAMEHISFQTPEHTLTALVGESGSGKTTVTNLLLRFWDVKSGAVRIGGVDVRAMSYDDLLASISIVMQNVQLFADTIEGNIRIGKAAATKEEVVAAAKKARIHDFILSLPKGYETRVGENGVGLSGGQKQRISIARAFLMDAPILLLDEVTSNVDPVNEALIQEAISELAQNRTVLVVAHHLSTIRSADQILVFKNGAIVQAGTHESLVRGTGGYYHALWNGSPVHVEKTAVATNAS